MGKSINVPGPVGIDIHAPWSRALAPWVHASLQQAPQCVLWRTLDISLHVPRNTALNTTTSMNCQRLYLVWRVTFLAISKFSPPYCHPLGETTWRSHPDLHHGTLGSCPLLPSLQLYQKLKDYVRQSPHFHVKGSCLTVKSFEILALPLWPQESGFRDIPELQFLRSITVRKMPNVHRLYKG